MTLKKILLFPFAVIYGIVTSFRNLLDDWKFLKSKSFEVHTICVGNLAVGGTGKTPHVEYLIKLLQTDFKIATLSRGYKRKTSGFFHATDTSTAFDIGDEPLQYKTKNPSLDVCVDADRVNGVKKILAFPEPPKVILLDDAFQHRHVTPGFSVVLVDYNRPIHSDTYLPLGRLRESAKGLNRAHCVIITRCPTAAKLDETVWRKALQLSPNQSLFFSTFTYEVPKPLFNGKPPVWEENGTQKPHVLVVTGIVSATGLYDYVTPFAETLHTLSFSDHHDFTKTELDTISNTFDRLPEPKLIITTEKAAARLLHNPFVSDAIKSSLYTVGIQVEFLKNQGTEFDKLLVNHVNHRA